jgi:hypothetical protein
MTKTPQFKLIRLGDAKRLTRGIFGPYAEVTGGLQDEPPM